MLGSVPHTEALAANRPATILHQAGALWEREKSAGLISRTCHIPKESRERRQNVCDVVSLQCVKVEGSGKVEFEHTPEGMRLRTLPYTSGLAS